MTLMTIGTVARHAGLAPSTLRYYEEIGLLPPPERMHGRRQYDAQVLVVLYFIQLAHKAGFRLSEIKTVLYDFAPDTPMVTRWKTVATARIEQLTITIAQATKQKRMLERGLPCACFRMEHASADDTQPCVLLGCLSHT